MTQVSLDITIAAPPERVWDVITQVERFPDWFPRLKEVRNPQGEPGTVGSTYEIVYEMPTGQEVEARSEILEAEPGELIVERFEVGGNVTGTGRWRLTRQPGEPATHVDMEADVEMEGGLLASLAEPAITAAMKHEAQNVVERFKEVCERQHAESTNG